MKRYSFDTADLITAGVIGVLCGLIFGLFQAVQTLWELVTVEDIEPELAEGSAPASEAQADRDKSQANGDMTPTIIKVKGRD